MTLATQEISKDTVLAGRYRVLRRLGSGGMATVFLAHDEKLGREVAVKRLHTDAPGASLKRFKREAHLGAALNHPNFVAVYDTVNAEEGALIVMEYVPGTSLAELAAGRRLSPERALPILTAVADALDHAHSEGVVHRDVKPANILVSDSGAVKLADLGIARAVGATQITSEGSVIGTLPYMAPERLSGPGSGGPESDVYALAAVAYELLSGEPPSRATSTEEAAAQAGAPDLAGDWPGAPAGAAAVLERGLDPEPGRRQPSAGRLTEELDAVLTGESEAETRRAFAPPPPTAERELSTLVRKGGRGTGTRPTASGRRGPALAALAVALLAVAGIALATGGGGGGDGADPAGSAATPAAEPAKEPKEPKPEPAPAAAEPAPAPATPSGAELNDQGFALINQGRYEEAIPVLEQAVTALEGGGDELTYGYALFNLGHALRLAGRPEEAIPILEQRLQIPNQQGEVRQELEAAYADAGRGPSGGDGGEGRGPDGFGPPGHDGDDD